jgi:hypothetical protein
MKIQALPSLFLALTAFGCASTGGSAGSSAQESAPPKFEEVMAAMMRAGTPGPEHKALEPLVGTFDAKVTMWTDPGTPPMESTGAMVNTWIYDGRYLEQKFEGDMGGTKFGGTGLFGFDVAAGKYIGLWYDSMSTGISNSVGTASSDGKKFTLMSTMTDPMTGKPATSEEIFTVEGPDKHTMEIFEDRGGKKIKSMEIVYTRKK